MKAPIMATVTAAAMLLALALPAIADRLDEVKARGRIIVGVSDATPPFTFRRPGEPDHAGYDIDLVRANFPETLLLAREKVAWGNTASVLTADNMLKARRMCEAFDDEAHACAA